MPTTLDLRRDHGALYRAGDVPELISVPPLPCLMVDGTGDPNSTPEYADAVATLYAVSYGLRAMAKAQGTVWTVMPLQGLWWADDPTSFVTGRREQWQWQWTMLIVQPELVTAEMVTDAVAQAVKKKKAPAADRLRLEVLDEGDAIQVMHHGPYADEGPTIAGLHADLARRGLGFRGAHHEIYLSDPRRAAPAAMRTIIRQPVE